MDVLDNARLFWKIVERTLVELYPVEPPAASELIAARRGSMTKASNARDLTYHSQPLHIAYNLARRSDPIDDGVLEKYDQIVARATAAGVDDVARPSRPRDASRESTEAELITVGSH